MGVLTRPGPSGRVGGRAPSRLDPPSQLVLPMSEPFGVPLGCSTARLGECSSSLHDAHPAHLLGPLVEQAVVGGSALISVHQHELLAHGFQYANPV
jgi:hypothetical protein